MSRYSHSHHNNHHSQSTVHRGRPVSQHEEALANNSFEHFLAASTLKTIFGTYRSICEHLHLKPNCIPYFYPKLKAHVNSWKAKPLWKKFDARVNQKCYNRGKSCPNTRVLIIGAGPCGLRSAIEAQLLGAKVVVVEKRDRMTRNNVLHLWPFVIEDLRALGAKKFFGKFCAGAIDHISIRQLQCILLKVALLLGVEIHTEVSFERLIEPNPGEKTGWRAEFKPTNHPVNQFEFDVIIGADGKRNTLQGFKRKEFRGKLAIAITANFINKRTEAEARVEEISGVAFIFNQKFFKDLYVDTGIDLENIVYYKDDTHYFVMTAKKQSLIDKGVIRQDLSDTAKLLAPENVDRDELMNYAREAAEFSTNYQMPDLEFAVNHYGQPDVAMFDFTSMYAAENASRITELHGYRLLAILVGDSLLEPFWPTGSGCARGFLSSMDAAWAIRSWETATPLQVIAERESIYRLLAQTTPENLNKDYKSYTLDPTTRYPNLNKNVLLPHQVTNLFDTDNPKSIDIRALPLGIVHGELPKKRRRRDSHVDPDTLLGWIQDQIKDYESVTISNITTSFKDGRVLCAIIHHYRPDLLDYGAINPNEPAKNNQIAFDILEKELGIPPVMSGTEMAQIDTPDFLTQLSYLTQIYDTFRCEIPHIKHPKLDLPDPKRTENDIKLRVTPDVFLHDPEHVNRPPSRHKRSTDAFASKMLLNQGDRKPRKRKTMEKIGASVDRENRLPSSLAKRETDEDFAARIKDMEQKWQDTQSVDKKPKDLLRAIGKIETSDWNIREIEKKIHENKMGKSVNKDKERVPKWSKEQFSARLTKMEKQHLDRQNSSEVKYAEIDKNIKQLDLKLKEGSALDLNQQKVASLTEKLTGKNEPVNPPKVQPIQKSNSKTAVVPSQNSEFCHFCQKRVYLMERLSAEGRFFHRGCFRCQYCQSVLRLGSYMFDREGIHGYRFYCTQHFGMPGELRGPKIEQKKVVPNQEGVSGKQSITGVLGLDLLDRVQTPERVEFANLSSGHISSDHEESPSPIDEDEWTDRNFRNSIIDSDSTDDSSSSSDTDSDDEEYEEALEEPITKEGNMKWAERYKKRYSHKYHDIYAENYSSSDHFSYDENSSGEDDSDTATEGEEEIRARELRKQEVRVEPPVPDTGTDTEVNPLSILPKTHDPNTPDLLKLENNTPSVNKSSDNLSTNSNEFNSAESELDDVKVEFQNLPLRKSATTSSVNNNNNNLKSKITVKPNFVIPPRKSSFGKEFIPTQDEKPPEPLLIIKRTPSKVNLPKEVGKPKVVVKADFSNAKKYFGDTTKKPFKPAQIKIKAPLVKQQSLPEKSTVKAEVAPKKETFNFEPEDCDMKDVDDYIENLLKHEDELLKPVDIKVVKQESSESDEKTSNSIEDLLKALETETCIKEEEEEFIDVKPEEKIEDLLAWMEELDHQAEETEVTKSLTGEKYKNLEDILKKSSDNIISKLSKNNISEFENHLLGKLPKTNSTNLAEENQQPKYVPFILQRSKTDVNCNKRSSVDLDAVKKVNIKKVLEKFENNDSPEPEVKPIRRNIVVPKNIVKRNSFANFSFNRSFEKEDPLLLPEHHRKSIGAKDFKLRAGVFENDNKEKEIDKVKMEKPINKLLQKGIGINKDLDVVKKPLEKHSNKFLLQRKSLPVTKLEGKVFDDHGSDENLSDEFENLVDKSDLNERLVTDLLNEMDLLNDIKDKLDEDEIEITKSDTNTKEENDEANNNIEKISPKIDDKEENKTVNYQERLKQLQDHINSIQKNLHVLPVTPESPKTINFDEIEQKISTYPTNFTQNAEDKTIKENNDNNFFQAAVTVKSRTFLPTTNVSDHDQDLDQNIINENVNNQNIIDQINEQNQNHPEINLKTEYTPPVPRRHKKESQIPRLIKQNSVEGETTLKPTPQLRAASVSPSMVRKFEPPPPIKPLRKRSSMSPMLPRRNLEEQNNNNKGSACSLAETNQNLTVKLNPKSTSAENVSSKSHEKRSKNTSNKDKECCIQ